MNAREAIARAMAEYWDRPEQAECYEVQADDVLTALSAAGFTIMSKEDAEAVREALAEYEAMADQVGGCGDSNCLVFRPVGQRTNGGCRCHYDKRKSQRMMAAGQLLYAAIRSLKSGGLDE